MKNILNYIKIWDHPTRESIRKNRYTIGRNYRVLEPNFAYSTDQFYGYYAQNLAIVSAKFDLNIGDICPLPSETQPRAHIRFSDFHNPEFQIINQIKIYNHKS